MAGVIYLVKEIFGLAKFSKKQVWTFYYHDLGYFKPNPQ